MEMIPKTTDGASAPEQTTLKLLSNRTHVGPATRRSEKSTSEFSAAAKKIKLNNDLKVTVANASTANAMSEKKVNPSSGQRSLLIENKGQMNPANAFTLMEAWDEITQGKPGTPDYIEKANKLNAVRSQVYAQLGFSTTDGMRPELTEEQRAAYSEAVRPYSFDYYEVRLSFKQPGKKAVRSKTYRYLEAPDLDSIKKRLFKAASAFSKEWSVRTGITN